MRRAMWALLGAMVGAIGGGAVMYAWTVVDAPSARQAMMCMPDVDARLIDRVGQRLQESGASEVLEAGWTGVPFKVLAFNAGEARIPFVRFIALSAVARLVRFGGTIMIAMVIVRLLPRSSLRTRAWLLAGIWGMVYAVYVVEITRR